MKLKVVLSTQECCTDSLTSQNPFWKVCYFKQDVLSLGGIGQVVLLWVLFCVWWFFLYMFVCTVKCCPAFWTLMKTTEGNLLYYCKIVAGINLLCSGPGWMFLLTLGGIKHPVCISGSDPKLKNQIKSSTWYAVRRKSHFRENFSGLKKCIAFGGKHPQTYLPPLLAALSCLGLFELVAIISCQTPA